MAHVKKNTMPKSWPIPRKGTKFVAAPSHAKSNGISLIIALRDMLRVARTRKEVRYLTLNGLIKVNNKVRKKEDFPLQIFDTLSFEKEDKHYRLEIINKKYSLVEISKSEAAKKIVKIIGKKILSSGVVQMNLRDGSNRITKDKFSVGDSVIINTKEDRIEKILPLKNGVSVEVIVGKHAGSKGKITGIEKLEKTTNYLVKLNDVEVSLPYKSILVIG